jgi:citrate synthase
MCGGVGGSPAAASLMAALAVGAGRLSGSREVFSAMQAWRDCGTDRERWRARLAAPPSEPVGIWPASEHPPGFDPHGVTVTTPVMQLLARLATIAPGSQAAWLWLQRPALERLAGHPLSLTGVAAAALGDLGFSPDEGEMLHLLLRLPGAAAHALEQQQNGHRKFPFYEIALEEPT